MSFRPDSPLVAQVCPSPNHGARAGGRKADMLILHYTGMGSAEMALRWLCDPERQVSAHYLVHEDGRILQLVPEARRAWHAGVASWAGESDINSCSIGIEIVNAGHDGGNPDFPPEQMTAIAALCADIVTRNHIPPARVLAHSDVAPARKQDPGEKFDWALLAARGAGLWVEPVPPGEGPSLGPGDTGGEVRALQEKLKAIGYGVTVSGVYDAGTEQAVTAFQRHFRKDRIDGLADFSTVATVNIVISRI